MEREEKLLTYAQEVLRLARNSLLMDYRFLDRILYQLAQTVDPEIPFGSDGIRLYYEPTFLLKDFQASPALVEYRLLHTLFHCLYMHPFFGEGKDQTLWDMSCDVYVSDVLLLFRSDKNGLAQTLLSAQSQRWISQLKSEVKFFSATGIYAHLKRELELGHETLENLKQKWEPLRMDAHPWYASQEESQEDQNTQESQDSQDSQEGDKKEEPQTQEKGQGKGQDQDQKQAKGPGQQEKKSSKPSPEQLFSASSVGPSNQATSAQKTQAGEAWKALARQVEVAINSNLAKGQGLDPGSLLSTLEHITRENESYHAFLRRFATPEEQMKVDMDEFDYIYYHLGMERYGNIPLVEPLEYREVPTLREFIIVLDTSGSCEDELIRKFLTKTYDILCEEQLFGTEMKVHVIQCDAKVQSDEIFTSRQEFEAYACKVKVLGRGGTDFRPAFDYVDTLLQKGELTKVDGLLYFTDGFGTYPSKPVSYPVAFIFSEVTKDLPVPPWAMRVFLESMTDLDEEF